MATVVTLNGSVTLDESASSDGGVAVGSRTTTTATCTVPTLPRAFHDGADHPGGASPHLVGAAKSAAT